MARIVSTGRGGSGKTTFMALLTKHFIEVGHTPLLLVDADPDQSLGEMVGVSLEEEGKMTVSGLLHEALQDEEGGDGGPQRFPLERLEHDVWERGLYEGEQFGLVSIGTKWTEGCYCVANEALKIILRELSRTYWHVLVDSPAGLEHLNRRIAPRVEDVFCIIDPSKKAFQHVERAHRIAEEVGIEFENFYVVGGYRFPEGMGAEVEGRTNLRYLGKMAQDRDVEEYVLSGRSLLELPNDSPAYCSLKRMLENTRYVV